MRLAGSIVCLCLLGASPSWAGSDIKELTRDNVESQSFEFKFKRADYWFVTVIKVGVRPKNEELSGLLDQLGGCVDRCQESANVFRVQNTAMPAKEEKGSLVYTLQVPKWAHKRCFYFWRMPQGTMPSMEIWWVNLDSPLVRGEEPPR